MGKCPLQKRVIVNENSAIRDIAAIYAKTPLSTLKEWQAFRTADQAAPYLNKAMVDSRFQYTKTITGVTQLRPRWKRAITLVDGSLGELVGQDYVQRYFPAASKAKMVELVAQCESRDGRAHPVEQLDERADQGGGAREATADGRDGRLSRQVPRL